MPEVSVDVKTEKSQDRFTMAADAGTIINRSVVDGQIYMDLLKASV